MKKITTIAELIAEIENGSYSYYGLRGASNHDMTNAECRGYLDPSHDWSDNEMSDELLNGTCAVGITDSMPSDRIADIYDRCLRTYSTAGAVLLIADREQEYGEDDGEVILGSSGCGADVVAIVELA